MAFDTISDSLFEELREKATQIWETYDNTYGYVDEKIGRLKELQNIKYNYGTIIGMFDVNNQEKLYNLVSDEAKEVIDNWVGGLDNSIRLAKELGMY